MKKVLLLVLVALASCDKGTPPVELQAPPVATPASSHSFLSAFTAVLPCNGQPLVFSIREQTAAWTALDGSINQSGLWIAPSCGSAWMGQTLHVDAKCAATGQGAFVSVVTVPEIVTGVQIAYAVRLQPLPVCLFADPTNVTGVTQAQFYARVITSCGDVVSPTPPATWPSVCP